MKLFHLGDLHLGKRVNGFSMIPDQSFLLDQIVELAKEEKPDGVLIAGDVYDKGVPPGEAVGLLDGFLTKLSQLDIFVCMIAGNHDSPERLDFASRLLQKNRIYIAGTFQKQPKKISLEDAYGAVHFYLLPFIKPQSLWPYYPENRPETYEQAMKMCVDDLTIEQSARNVLVAHQFVTWRGEAKRSDSESASVGGVGEIDAGVFSSFDYTALGHLHQPQKMGSQFVRYAGSPLKYSFSEVHQKKAVTVVELFEKGRVEVSQIPLIPLRDMRQIKGPLEALLKAGEEDTQGREDYIQAILTNEEPLVDPLGKLRHLYPNLMLLDFENAKNRTQNPGQTESHVVEDVSPEKLFGMFYEKQMGQPLNTKQIDYLMALWQKEEWK